ncbi:ABC transporter permease [Halococcus saccharolyticus]|uniref:Binding-protein-dependent transporters inner membrane component n=1 Tax=Halococcus saccharolyticus DSM 5350 TaxID=1227455 RepID=M0MDI8_9EURY|nr:ABC transporter permease [Halococcus saccharolyticus]EMA42734.1 binding-protein-dependent transporters inner membrane component [Halococcus saccharolyticus DSM 5350]
MSQELTQEDEGIVTRLRANPRPALIWLLGALALVAVEFGALVHLVTSTLPWTGTIELPTLLSRELIPNAGYQLPSGAWEETFLGLAPAYAWALRVGLVFAYAFAWLAWLWYGYLTFRRHYRFANWTPTDDRIDRLRDHRWGQFGFIVVVVFVVLAMFAPALGPTTLDKNIINPYGHEVQYFDEDVGEVTTASVGTANLASQSTGTPGQNYGLGSYDEYDRFHPLGTITNGKDMFTEMVYGARVSLFIGLFAMGLACTIAMALALVSAYYKGITDLIIVVTSDGFASLPFLLILIMLGQVLRSTWIANLYNGAFLIALLLGIFRWPSLWRTVRGPAFQTVENEWVDAARSYGQTPITLMRKHVAPYVVSYLLIYASLGLGGVIIVASALSYLGLGVTAPTPEWGRLVALGQQYVPTASWHISIIPGLAIVLVVTGFNALGDGIRDALDPESESESGGGEAAAAGGGA